ncbi:MAG: MBL fold metallo-hydrolase [Clostridia bacterium]|nr:MBL fold metallo-hydrolase [Clostridia bacterium]
MNSILKNRILATDITDTQIAVFYFGQESILIKSKGKYYLFDAYLSDYVDKNCSNELVRWERLYPAPIRGDELDFVDYVFCSHAHYDHMDPETIGAIAKVNKKAKFIVPAPSKDTVTSYGVKVENVIPAIAGDRIDLGGGASVMPIASAHEELVTDEFGRYDALGYKLSLGEISVYHAGDCCIYDGLEEAIGKVDIACLPVNGRSYYKRYIKDIIGNMDAYEASELAIHVGADLLIPMHIDLYAVNGISFASFTDAVTAVSGELCFHIFRPGERYIYSN